MTFSAAGSSDPDGDDLSYAWDLDGDGDFADAIGVTAHRTYAEPGSVEAGVLVSDPFGESAEAHVTVTAGNTPPRPVIDAPANGASWSVGEPIAFHGSAEDDQEKLGPDALLWVLTLDHCPQVSGCHTHPIEHVTGASGTISGPEHDYPSRVVLTLVATDSGGLTGSASVKLEPRPAHVRVKTDTAGTEVSLDGIEGADVQRTVIAGTRVVVAAAAQQAAGDVLWKFEGWDDGVFTATRALLPKADVTLTARFTRAATPTPTPAAEDAAPEPSPTAQEPGPVAPVAERTPPRITVPRQSARRLAAVLPLDASCRPECRLSARATLRAAGAEHRLPRPRSRARGAGRRFELRLPAKARAAARNALKRQRAARLEIVITARDSAGARRTVRVRMPLRLR